MPLQTDALWTYLVFCAALGPRRGDG